MRKSTSSEVVLSSGQLQAVRLNNLEMRRMHRHIDLLHGDLQSELNRLQRQAQGLRIHFTNVVRVIKPNRAYQTWKNAHAKEIAADRTNEFIGKIVSILRRKSLRTFLLTSATIKAKNKAKLKKRTSIVVDAMENERRPTRPLLLLIDHHPEPESEPVIDFQKTFLRPKTSPMEPGGISANPRSNPLLNVLLQTKNEEKRSLRREKTFTSNPNGFTLPRLETKSAKLDTLYRIALQNQTAYQAVDKSRIENRKTEDKDFASKHRAMKGSIRAASVLNHD